MPSLNNVSAFPLASASLLTGNPCPLESKGPGTASSSSRSPVIAHRADRPRRHPAPVAEDVGPAPLLGHAVNERFAGVQNHVDAAVEFEGGVGVHGLHPVEIIEAEPEDVAILRFSWVNHAGVVDPALVLESEICGELSRAEVDRLHFRNRAGDEEVL